MYITASSTISHQNTFQNKGFSLQLSELKQYSELITPDYSTFIPAMERRRMSAVLKMSIACAIDCIKQAEITQPDGIIVGTSMGCCIHTKIFLDKIIAANEGPVSPTSFIVSTHNTIAGQISLILKNKGYNITHTQNSLSFEQGLIDAMLCVSEGFFNVLVGGADEEEGAIYNMKARLNNEEINVATGASFFILSNSKTNDECIQVVDVGSFGLVDNLPKTITRFLNSNNISQEEIDVVLFSSSTETGTDELKSIFKTGQLFDYQKITGTYLTNAAFAMHYAIDLLVHKKHSVPGHHFRKVLLCNNLIPENVGLILLQNKSELS